MFWIRLSILFLFFSGSYHSVSSQPYPCDGRLIFSAANTTTTTFSLAFSDFRAVYYSPMTSYLGKRFDAVGFNPTDNFIYGVEEHTNSIVRLHINGTYEVVGTVPEVDTLKVYAGDCSPEGLYFCHDSEIDKLMVFEVTNDFEKIEELDLYWSPASVNSGPFTTKLEDFVIDPNDAKVAYAFQGHYDEEDFAPVATRGYLLKINLDFADPDVGMVTPLFSIPDTTVLQLESLFFTKDGQLYGIGPRITYPFRENQIVSIYPSTATAEKEGLIPPPATQLSDGCSCPYSVSFQNDIVPRHFTCSDTTVNFVLTITNDSYQQISGVHLADTLPEGIIIKEISNGFVGDIVAGTGVGTGMLVIQNLEVPPKETVTIDMTTEVIDIQEWLIYNQAYLTNLPLLLGGSKLSDEPRTPELLGDASGFVSTPVLLEDVTMRAVSPTDCLSANDAKIQVTSSKLPVGKNMSVTLSNENFELFSHQVTVNNEHTFLIDSLLPGVYTLENVSLEDVLCGYTWETRTITIEAPNDIIQTNITTNSPICEGETLKLNGTMSPTGTITWSGPEGFTSSDLSPLVSTAPNDYSGTFEMLASYGFCRKVKPIDIIIAPAIDAKIAGDSSYCERAPVHLRAEGNGNIESLQWFGPDGLLGQRRHVRWAAMTAEHNGIYQVVIDNGICTDTASTEIRMFPSPTIEMPRLEEIDFCIPHKLRPVILGDNNVIFSWTRKKGLDCYDCPTPELQIPFLPSYQLNVINGEGCADTATVQVVLDKRQLMYAPNVFSPNFDGRNDYFQMFPGCGVASLKNMIIMNRWGAIVFSKKEIDFSVPTEFWDGRVGGQPAAAGVYIWQVEMGLVDGTELRISGDVGVIR